MTWKKTSKKHRTSPSSKDVSILSSEPSFRSPVLLTPALALRFGRVVAKVSNADVSHGLAESGGILLFGGGAGQKKTPQKTMDETMVKHQQTWGDIGLLISFIYHLSIKIGMCFLLKLSIISTLLTDISKHCGLTFWRLFC